MSDFASHLLYLATLQIVTKSSPFTHAKSIPLHALSHLVADYLQLLAQAAKAHAELAGRDRASVWDVAKALEEFGTSTLGALREDVEQSDGGGEEGDRLRDLAGGLKELLDPQPQPDPIARLGYHPLEQSELDALAILESEPQMDESSSVSSSDESEIFTPPSSAWSPPRVHIKDEDSDPFDLTTLQQPLTTSWRDPALIPTYIPDFLPPFPGMERETDIPEPVRRRREREREREVAAAAWAGANEGADSQDPWIATIPYASSSLQEAHPASALPPASPPSTSTSRRRRRSLSPRPTTSLTDFKQTAAAISSAIPTFQRINPKRRVAANAISGSADFTLLGDSLFGNVPVPQIRHAGVTAGFLPDGALSSFLHPFNTSLPHTVATSVPKHPSPHAPLLVPLIHPRIPTIMESVTSYLSGPSGPNVPLFNRLTRIGPPGPLGPAGEAANYEYIGSTSTLEMSVEWATRPYNQALPRSAKMKEREGEAEGTSGIKLQLKIGRAGSVPGTGSPAATPGGTWNGYTESPMGFPGMGDGASGNGSGYLDSVIEEGGGEGQPIASGSGMIYDDQSAIYQDPNASTDDIAASFLQQLDAIQPLDPPIEQTEYYEQTPFDLDADGTPTFDVSAFVEEYNEQEASRNASRAVSEERVRSAEVGMGEGERDGERAVKQEEFGEAMQL